MNDIARRLGSRIRQIRKAEKLSQERLAEKVGMTRESISRMESGVLQPSLNTLSALSAALNVNAKDLFDFKGPVVFRGGKLEAKQRKECLDSITATIKEMDLRELIIAKEMIQFLAGTKIAGKM